MQVIETIKVLLHLCLPIVSTSECSNASSTIKVGKKHFSSADWGKLFCNNWELSTGSSAPVQIRASMLLYQQPVMQNK